MIELITGGTGSGKTTFLVAERLVHELQRELVIDDQESATMLGVDLGHRFKRRICQAGIRGLKLEHERLGHQLTRDAPAAASVARWNAFKVEKDPETGKSIETDEPAFERLPGDPPVAGIECCVQNWWLWAMPGDLIVIDEAQWLCPRTTMGKKPPPWIMKLEVHRHYGVDFILCTQDPGLIDVTVRKLVVLHRHVRPMFASPVCVVFSWDHASNPEAYAKANKSKFIRKRSHFKLFHSTVAVMKPPSTGRWGLVAFPLLLLGGLGTLGAKITGLVNSSDQMPAAAASAPVPGQAPGQARPHPALHVAARPAHLELTERPHQPRPPGLVDVPQLQGCYSVGSSCTCLDLAGHRVALAPPICRQAASSYDGLIPWERSRSVRYSEPGQPQPAAPAASRPGLPLPVLPFGSS